MDVNVLLFDDFETLDVFGPVEVLGRINDYRLRFISANGGVIKSKQGTEILTQSTNDADDSGILLIPGGQGTRALVNDYAFIEALKQVACKSTYCLTVCTGSALLAKTGLLDRRTATSNKRAFEWVKSISSNVDWITHARWVADGKFYTSSGVSAGMDMSLGFVADRFGNHISTEIADAIEYIWNADKDNDPFAR
ncbi:ThiJ/PfpI domain-containing protein [uncultured Eubacteriales bacterium]|uniref:ThiJ/PfpI domain-containing protein n=1 Tax=uncultured Eubacteriales bacterium TaxID=172733 RepID=A0A212IUX3_9FIRM|nr:ThiJ/PfpI domain-containing protein [uncultured Eubacteriales bacterium]